MSCLQILVDQALSQFSILLKQYFESSKSNVTLKKQKFNKNFKLKYRNFDMFCPNLRTAPDLEPCHRNTVDEERGSESSSNSQPVAAVDGRSQSYWLKLLDAICVLQTSNTAGSQRDSVTAWYSHQLVAVSFSMQLRYLDSRAA